jgi:hypothetical protein
LYLGVLPELRQMWYCLCDIQLPLAQKICRLDYLETLRECDPVTGWLPVVLKKRFLKTKK